MNSVTAETMPLFPLGRPLYPGIYMNLRIFEQRYLKLVRDSMATGQPFGIVPITAGGEVGKTPSFFNWGTLVNITDFDQQPDGLLGITISGNQRFSVFSHKVQDDGLIVAEIGRAAAESNDPCSEVESDLNHLLQELVEGLGAAGMFADNHPDLAQLSWRLATLLPLPAQVKVSLLKESDPEIRLDIIRECLTELAAREGPVN